MTKIIDGEKWRKDGRTPEINSEAGYKVNLDVKVAMLSPLAEREIIFDLAPTNSNVIVVSNPKSNELVPEMRIVAEDGGFEKEEKINTKTTRGRSKSGASREIGDR